MGRTAPFAEAIRALRPRVERARRAHTDACRLQGVAADTAAGDPGLQGELVAEIAAAWPDLGASAGELAQGLRAASVGVAALEAELTRLRHDQHDELHDEAWGDVVAMVRELAMARDGLVADLSRARARRIAATSLRDALDGTLAEADALDEAAASGLHEAARASYQELLVSLDLQLPARAERGRAWLEATRTALDALATILDPAVEAQEGRVAAIDTQLEELLG